MATKTLILKERKNVWAILLKVETRSGTEKSEVATFAKRAYALCALAGTFNNLRDWMFVDQMEIHCSQEGLQSLYSVGIVNDDITTLNTRPI